MSEQVIEQVTEQVTEQADQPIIVVPSIDVKKHTVSTYLWETLKTEIDNVVARIDNNEELTPEDVKKARSLRKQVDEYVKNFNQSMREKQDEYKNLVQRQLISLGYQRIENYINVQKQKQTKEQNDRVASKLSKFQELVNEVLSETDIVKDTVLANEMISLLSVRFPNVKSGAKDKEVKDWAPYKAVISTSLNLLDTFFKDEQFPEVATLPLSSASMQQLMKYLRSGDIEELKVMRQMYEMDKHYFDQRRLRAVVTTKDVALGLIRQVLDCSDTTSDKLANITKILNIATTLQN